MMFHNTDFFFFLHKQWIVNSKRRSTSARNHSQIAILWCLPTRREWDHECKTVALRDTVPNKCKYYSWPEGVPLWLIGGCWRSCTAEPISCPISFIQTQIGLMFRWGDFLNIWEGLAACSFPFPECGCQIKGITNEFVWHLKVNFN